VTRGWGSSLRAGSPGGPGRRCLALARGGLARRVARRWGGLEKGLQVPDHAHQEAPEERLLLAAQAGHGLALAIAKNREGLWIARVRLPCERDERRAPV